jgi:hypothetical protein
MSAVDMVAEERAVEKGVEPVCEVYGVNDRICAIVKVDIAIGQMRCLIRARRHWPEMRSFLSGTRRVSIGWRRLRIGQGQFTRTIPALAYTAGDRAGR